MDNGGIYGVIGGDVAKSLSPVIHNAMFRRYGMRARYHAYSVKNVKDALKILQNPELSGANITMPFKESVVYYLHGLKGDASKIRVVNTIVKQGSQLVGYNTDGIGALRALSRFTKIVGQKILILGGGGAAKAIGYVLSRFGNVLLMDRKISRVRELQSLNLHAKLLTPKNLKGAMEKCDILINATPVGMKGDDTPVPAHLLHEDMLVMDIVYNPVNTKLLKDSRVRGCITVDGLWMLAEQAAESFKLWTGRDGDAEYMREVALEAIK